MARDWKAILTEAKEQGLYASQVAVRQGCKPSTVAHAIKSHGIKLRIAWRGGKEKRDWRAVLTAAQDGGLSAAEVARAEKVTLDAVIAAQSRYNIKLIRKPYRRGRPKGAGKHGGSYARLHTEAFVAAAKQLETANAFCIRLGIGIDVLKRLERAHGIALPRRTPRPIGART